MKAWYDTPRASEFARMRRRQRPPRPAVDGAVVDGDFRYTLRRTLAGTEERRICWILLHPGSADRKIDDSTIRRLRLFSERWGFGVLDAVSLFAFRAATSRDLLAPADPVGPLNDIYVERAAQGASLVVAAWGGAPLPLARRQAVATSLRLRSLGLDLWSLGPRRGEVGARHPLDAPIDAELERY